MANAKDNFKKFKLFLQKEGWKFDEFETENIYTIQSGVNTENRKILFYIYFKDEDIIFTSILPLHVQKNFDEMAKEITKINSEYVKYGRFDLNFENGEISFVFTSITDGMKISNSFIQKVIMGSCITIDEFTPYLEKIIL